jgi:hypothetical protein
VTEDRNLNRNVTGVEALQRAGRVEVSRALAQVAVLLPAALDPEGKLHDADERRLCPKT